MDQVTQLTDAVVAAINRSDLPNGAIGRVLFNAFLAVATRAKGERLTVNEITRLCANETEDAFRKGYVAR